MQALYRSGPADDWIEVSIIGRHESGKIILRELGKPLPGLFLADDADIRLPVVTHKGLALVGLAGGESK